MSRPTNLRENNENYYVSYPKGCHVGFETLLSLLGWYNEEEVVSGQTGDKLIIDAEPEESQTTVQVVGLGLGRTGTTSLAMALEILGYAVLHDDEQPEVADLAAAIQREEITYDELHDILGLRGYNASFKSDIYWVESHPEVKAILTVRDSPEQYVSSWLLAAPFADIMEQAPFKWMRVVRTMMPDLHWEYRVETTGEEEDADHLDPETLEESYVEYMTEIQDALPSDQLLTFNVKEGWKPLCEFLGIDNIPNIPFPHVHTRAKLQGEMIFLKTVTWIWPLVLLLPLFVVYCSYLIAGNIFGDHFSRKKVIKCC